MRSSAGTAGTVARGRARTRLLGWGLAIFAVAVTVAVLIAYAVEEPLRRRLEQTLNAQLRGYRVQIEALDVRPHDFGLALRGVTIRQDAHPKPPVLSLDAFEVGLQWPALLRLAVVADVYLLAPRLHVNREQLAAEARDDVAVNEKGWQAAVQAIYPLEINHLVIEDGAATYVEKAGARPIRIADLRAVATNIRNVADPDDPYPSTVRLRAAVFERGTLQADGHANFLAEPQPTVRVRLALEDVPLERLHPVAEEANLRVRGGTLSAQGAVETTPEQQRVTLDAVRLAGVQLDYINPATPDRAAAQRLERAEAAAREVAGEPATRVQVDVLELRDASLGYVDRAADPEYRVFVDALSGELRDLRLGGDKPEPARVSLNGAFMDSGPLRLDAVFMPRERDPDLELALQIESTELRTLNDLLRAKGNLDVAGGQFSFYSNLTVRNGQIEGYVKPLFRDVDVYDRAQDRDESLLQQAYEGLAGGVAGLLENPREQVATQTDISGRTESPDVSTVQVLVNLIRNAFFDAILPGLEQSLD